MVPITSAAGLKNAIQLLEIEQEIKGRLLKDHFQRSCESLKPLNLIRSSLIQAASSSNIIDTVLSTAIGLATGYVAKKMVVGVSGNIFRKLFGIILQLVVTKAVAQHPEAVKSFGEFITQHILSKKKRILRSRDC